MLGGDIGTFFVFLLFSLVVSTFNELILVGTLHDAGTVRSGVQRRKYRMRLSTHDAAKFGQKFVNEPEFWKQAEK